MDSVPHEGDNIPGSRRFTAILPATGWTVENVTRMKDGHWDAWVDRVVAFAQVEDDAGSYLLPLVAEGGGAVVLAKEAGVFSELRHDSKHEDREREKELIAEYEDHRRQAPRGAAA